MSEVRGARAAGAAQLLIGAGILARPGARGAPPAVARVLGVRSVGQGLAVALRADATAVRLGVASDLLHATTMVAAMAIWPKYRRAAATSAALAVASAGLGLGALASRPAAQAVRDSGSTR